MVPPASRLRCGFSLVELLTVIALIGLMTAFVVPALGPLLNAGNLTKSSSDLGTFLQMAREHALAKRTFVRVGFHQASGNPGELKLTVVAMVPLDGTLLRNSSTDLGDPQIWNMIGRPLTLNHVGVDDGISSAVWGSATPLRPSESDLAPFSRHLAGGQMNFQDSGILILPNGQMRVLREEPSRALAIGLLDTRQQNNRALIYINGLTGGLRILREENIN